jgi:hypothetical protein
MERNAAYILSNENSRNATSFLNGLNQRPIAYGSLRSCRLCNRSLEEQAFSPIQLPCCEQYFCYECISLRHGPLGFIRSNTCIACGAVLFTVDRAEHPVDVYFGDPQMAMQRADVILDARWSYPAAVDWMRPILRHYSGPDGSGIAQSDVNMFVTCFLAGHAINPCLRFTITHMDLVYQRVTASRRPVVPPLWPFRGFRLLDRIEVPEHYPGNPLGYKAATAAVNSTMCLMGGMVWDVGSLLRTFLGVTTVLGRIHATTDRNTPMIGPDDAALALRLIAVNTFPRLPDFVDVYCWELLVTAVVRIFDISVNLTEVFRDSGREMAADIPVDPMLEMPTGIPTDP